MAKTETRTTRNVCDQRLRPITKAKENEQISGPITEAVYEDNVPESRMNDKE